MASAPWCERQTAHEPGKTKDGGETAASTDGDGDAENAENTENTEKHRKRQRSNAIWLLHKLSKRSLGVGCSGGVNQPVGFVGITQVPRQ